jgi:maltose O-acetyltransferase
MAGLHGRIRGVLRPRSRVREARTRLAIATFHLWVNDLAASALVSRRMRRWMYRRAGIETDTHRIEGRCFINRPRVAIGAGTYVNHGCHFDAPGCITIGRGCAFGPEVLLCTSTHDFGRAERRAGTRIPRPIVVGDGCWVGARAVVLPGVTVGSGCVIAAGAVVAADCASNGLYAGVPARRIRDLAAGGSRA